MKGRVLLKNLAFDDLKGYIDQLNRTDNRKFKNKETNKQFEILFKINGLYRDFLSYLLKDLENVDQYTYESVLTNDIMSDKQKCLLILWLTFDQKYAKKRLEFYRSDLYNRVMGVEVEDTNNDNEDIKPQKLSEVIKEDLKMSEDNKIYIGYIKHEKSYDYDFYNLYVRYIYENGVIIKADKNLFPPHGKINLSGNIRDYIIQNDYLLRNYLVFSYNDLPLTENTNKNQAEYKISDIFNIRNINECNIYKIIEPSYDNSSENGRLLIQSENYLYSKDNDPKYDVTPEKVIVKYEIDGETLYLEPSKLCYRDQDNQFYINNNLNKSKFAKCINEKDLNEVNSQLNYYDDEITKISSYNKVDEKAIIDNKYFATATETLTQLIEEMETDYCSEDGYIHISNIEKQINSIDKNLLLGLNISAQELEKIKNNLLDYIYKLEDNGNALDEIFQVVCKVILKNEGEITSNNKFNDLIEYVCKSKSVLNKLENYSEVQYKVEELETKSKTLIDEVKDLEYKIYSKTLNLEEIENKISINTNEQIEKLEIAKGNKLQELDYEVNGRNNKLEAIEAEIRIRQINLDAIIQEYSEHKVFADLKTDVDYLEKHKQVLEQEKEKLEIACKKIKEKYEAEFSSIINRELIKKRETEINSQKIIDDENSLYSTCLESVRSFPAEVDDNFDFSNYIISQINKVRDYTNDEIINIFASIYTGFLTIFSGRPGTGKTSICNIISEVLGLNSFGYEKDVNKNMYISVPVQRGWTSKRDLLGYYNPLTKQFDKNNKHLFDCLKIQDKELESNESGYTKFPACILLDEANLSAMEYYWSDFIQIADNDNDTARNLNLGNGIILKIAKNLKFLATINNDHTTEQLSPRIIDRAWIINMSHREVTRHIENYSEQLQENREMITWDILREYFEKNRGDFESGELKNFFNEIISKFENLDIFVSPRSMKLIKNYVEITLNKYDNVANSLDYVIAQKLIPMISGSGSDYKRMLEELKAILEDGRTINGKKIRLPKSVDLISKILAKGTSMQYYTYFN
ncbi:MAG: hypothetical protein R3Y09_02255 [Clostridia bacterium]